MFTKNVTKKKRTRQLLSYDCEQGGCVDGADGGDSFLLQEPIKKMATPLVCFTTTSKQLQTLVTNLFMRDTLSQNPREA